MAGYGTSYARFLVLLAVLMPQAAAPTGPSAGDVVVLEVSPVQRPPAILMPNAQVPAAPGPVEAGRLAGILEGLGESGDAAAAESLRLTAATPWLDDRAYLILQSPGSVHPESSIRFDAGQSGFPGLKLNVEAGRVYLLDFAVRAEGPGSYRVEAESAGQDFEALRAYMQRLGIKFPFFSVLTPLPGSALFTEMEDNLTIANYEFFDLAHAVIPTRLPPAEFYQEFAGLWRWAYPPWKIGIFRAAMAWRDLVSRRGGLAVTQRALTDIQQHGDARVYLRDWGQAKGEKQRAGR